MSSPPVYLFVYGTLRQGGAGAGLLAGAKYVAAARMAGSLYSVDQRFPALVPGGSGTVQGELWECPAELLARLDRYEGIAQGLFRRERCRIGEVEGWVYAAGPRLRRHLVPANRVAGGRWTR